ncbi:AAA+ family ATPase [Desulfocurvibacter africanus PCS]|uniref:Uncharacterized AAA domain-containing protein ycf46 n=1 Tax=Desulfocurvibacter africanus PCS TaxID=1262666 RepID=M5Q260_DESAF|nr:AAA family ATPase [Desulfocurvibacter africanus]EMG37143.1 AAA+ family ATPase [Desulfocurvibacter africanus PCS]
MLQDYLRAGYPAILITTQEPHRLEELLPCQGWKFHVWDCIGGIRMAGRHQTLEEIQDPVEAINWLGNFKDTVLVAFNLHLFLDNPEVIQAIFNGVPKWKSVGSCLVMVSPTIQLRAEIEKLFTVIELPLPDEPTLFGIQGDIGKACNIRTNRKAARAARGLTEFEAEAAFALSAIEKRYFSTRVIARSKAQIIKKSGLMDTWEPTSIREVGGLDGLKKFIRSRAKALLPHTENLPRPKGILLVGIPGTGKSLSCKAAASILNWPLIRLDIGALKNSLVGESERRMREATKVIDAFGEAVIWLDEIEKGFAGVLGSGRSDGGTSASMFGHFLNWMQETKSPCLIMATANDISLLPPEFMRAGRFDATFFVDLPTNPERSEIIRIMNRKYGTEIPLSYVDKLAGYTGAEIEQIAKDSLFDGLDEAYKALVPLSRTMREKVQSLRDWAKTRARLANTPEPELQSGRKVRSGPVGIPAGPHKAILN